jgi:hypothetical protein
MRQLRSSPTSWSYSSRFSVPQGFEDYRQRLGDGLRSVLFDRGFIDVIEAEKKSGNQVGLETLVALFIPAPVINIFANLIFC